MRHGHITKAAFIGTHSPRRCGIATFTADLANAVRKAGIETTVVAVSDKAGRYHYPKSVGFEIDQHSRQSHHDAADFLNSLSPDVVCVQHEFGVYGGDSGSDLLELLRNLQPPIVSTLHTILESPNAVQSEVLAELLQLSERVVTMTEHGRSILQSQYDVSSSKLVVIPHGIPVVGKPNSSAHLRRVGFEGKKLILTFGLISRDKGIENMILAMPEIVKDHPDVIYLIAGATHPQVKATSGEGYRKELEGLVSTLGLTNHVRFINQFLSMDSLTELLHAADIYVTPYLKKQQITSGTLAYAFGAGKAVVSTPYWHAEELLANGRGVLVPFRDPSALASSINGLLSDSDRLERLQLDAYEAGLGVQWPMIGRRYGDLFQEAKDASIRILPSITARTPSWRHEVGALPKLDLRHLLAMTDDTGMLQHATYAVPNRREGYCTDDNARAAILATELQDTEFADLAGALQIRYLSFLDHALDQKSGRMRNFMSFDRKWLERAGSQDSHGRAVWALGHLACKAKLPGVRSLASELMDRALPVVGGFSNLRSFAFALLGLDACDTTRNEPHRFELMKRLADRIHAAYLANSEGGWNWFEPLLTYDNARLPQALLLAGLRIGNNQMVQSALSALDWLVHVQADAEGKFLPIGSDGFYFKGSKRAIYDQQPIEAVATLQACQSALALGREDHWEHEAWRAFAWFLGANSTGEPVYDETTGGCHDAVTKKGVNHNEGAESTLAFLSALLSIRKVDEPSRSKGNLLYFE